MLFLPTYLKICCLMFNILFIKNLILHFQKIKLIGKERKEPKTDKYSNL